MPLFVFPVWLIRTRAISTCLPDRPRELTEDTDVQGQKLLPVFCLCSDRAAGQNCQAPHKTSAENRPLKSHSHHHSLWEALPWAASAVSEWWILKPTWLVCSARMLCSLLRMGCASLVLWSMDEQWVVELGHQSSVTGLRSRRYSFNNSWPEKDQRYFTFSTIPCPQGVPSAVFHLARLEKIWKFIGQHDYLKPKALAGYVDVCIQLWSWGISGLVESQMAHNSHQSVGRDYRERSRRRVPPWSAIFLKCLSMLEVSPSHHGQQQILSSLHLCPTLHTKTLLPCLLQGHSQRLKLAKQFWISGYNQTLALLSSATISSSWDHKGNRI